ncbi:MAG: M23 family metallopeptidase [Acetobacteraceae bacterium]|nr:M23 family metallopeptidase [Acetobacteraceae bacterium]
MRRAVTLLLVIFALAALASAPPAAAEMASQQATQAPTTPASARGAVSPRAASGAQVQPALSRPTPAKPAPAASSQTTSQPMTAQRATVRLATHGHPGPHPGLGDNDYAASTAEAYGMCGQMQMPAAALREVSRGFRSGHAGLDLMAPHGSPARAAAAGSVLYAGWYYAYGNIVDLRHSDGVVTRYAHLSSVGPDITPGAMVLAGDEIGKVGATGRATSPHIHFEVRIGGRPVDPRPYLALASCTPGSSPETLESYADELPIRRPRRPTK